MKMFMKVDEAAKRLNIHPKQVRYLCKTSQLQEFYDGDTFLIKVAQIELLAEGNLPKLPDPESLPDDEGNPYKKTLGERIKALFSFK